MCDLAALEGSFGFKVHTCLNSQNFETLKSHTFYFYIENIHTKYMKICTLQKFPTIWYKHLDIGCSVSSTVTSNNESTEVQTLGVIRIQL